jgi:uncharacterized repeat protein (TIGR01451 family)
MGSLLSAISGQFAKMLILGTLFPVVIMSALNLWLIAPLLPLTKSLPGMVEKIAAGGQTWAAIVFTLVLFVLTGLLYDLNIPIIRIYEGYPWQGSLLGRACLYGQKRRLQKTQGLASDAKRLRQELTAADPGSPVISDLRGQETALALLLNTEWPDEEALLLPTRLGNVIRCFERYPFLAYGMDAIVLWPRLVAKIDPNFASTIDEAKTAFDFMLNLSFLSALTCVSALAIGLALPAPLRWCYASPWVWRALAFLTLAAAFYYLAVNRAQAWGEQVRAAFDLYRLDLLKALGYQQKPLTYQEERAIWFKISSQIQYANDRILPLPYEDPLTRVVAYPTDIPVEVRRSYKTQEANLRIPVVIELKNPDSARAVTALTVVDSLPDGYSYVADSVSVSSGGFEVRRVGPLEVFFGPIAAGGTLTLKYSMKPASSPSK